MKKLLALCFALIVTTALGTHAFAAPAPLSATLWYTPSDATPGEVVELNALVYNDTAEEVSVTVTFSGNNVLVATTGTILIPTKTAKVATARWLMPTEKITLTATAAKVLSKAKKDVPALHGVLGTVVVGGTSALAIPEIPPGVKGFAAKIVNFLEGFRLKELAYFTRLYDKSKEVLGTTTLKDVSTILQPDTAPKDTTTDTTVAPPEEKKPSNTMGYLQLLYATSGKAFFGHKAVYYVVLILAILLIFRFIFNRLL